MYVLSEEVGYLSVINSTALRQTQWSRNVKFIQIY
jgi:hypothetical protein